MHKIWADMQDLKWFQFKPKSRTILGIVFKYIILDFRDHIKYKIVAFTKLYCNNITIQSYFIYCLPSKTNPSFILLTCMEVDGFDGNDGNDVAGALLLVIQSIFPFFK